MKKQANSTIKYCAFNSITHVFYLCTSKKALSKTIGCSTRTILRKELIYNKFVINDWHIEVDTVIHKQPKRNDNLN